MFQTLRPHPDTPCPAVSALEAEVVRTGGGLTLAWRLTGDLAHLAIPARAAAERTDGLWNHTCFEAFVAAEGEGYLEFNIAPSTHWAAYRFDGYRQGMAALEIAAPKVETVTAGDVLEVRVALDVPLAGPWRIGLTAVIEAADGALSYWALAHPPGQPDFHHADGRVLAL
jgi:hypothetical protein